MDVRGVFMLIAISLCGCYCSEILDDDRQAKVKYYKSDSGRTYVEETPFFSGNYRAVGDYAEDYPADVYDNEGQGDPFHGLHISQGPQQQQRFTDQPRRFAPNTRNFNNVQHGGGSNEQRGFKSDADFPEAGKREQEPVMQTIFGKQLEFLQKSLGPKGYSLVKPSLPKPAFSNMVENLESDGIQEETLEAPSFPKATKKSQFTAQDLAEENDWDNDIQRDEDFGNYNEDILKPLFNDMKSSYKMNNLKHQYLPSLGRRGGRKRSRFQQPPHRSEYCITGIFTGI